ncbi:ATP-binding protein [Metabacillus sp. GX 13764]|uniref:two-component system sensor histidine kinase NtrB n=1 Tax=Metabacillus kandeliae TaxID=2900151 RepID=UPI001E505F10|nr:ATP-binding protein [Metabacillus kandeliae]MCD7036101.1 ATP-binding protein [Metabacillus kandeliae]
MNKQQLIIKRNKLFLLLLWACYVMDTGVLFFLSFERYVYYWASFLIPLLVLTIAMNKIKRPILMMYLLSSLIYAYIIMLNEAYPSLVNYVFLLLPLLLVMVFQDKYILIYCASVTAVLQIYYFVTKYDVMAGTFEQRDLFYYILLTFMVFILLFFYLRFINRLWNTANKRTAQVVEELNSAKAHFSLIFKQSQDAIAILDISCRVLAVNPAFEELYGWKGAELEKQPYPLRGKMNGSYKEYSSQVVNRTDMSKDGKRLDVEVRISPIYDESGTLIAYSEMIRDVTDKLEQEQLLFQAEKLKVAGEMAAGVAHEIRNPLTVLQGFIQIMKEKNPDDELINSLMLSELKRVNDIVSEFLVLAKPQAVNFSSFSLNTVLEETMQLFNSETLLKNISLQYKPNKEPLVVYGERNQIKQVLINLLKNSCDAISANGEIHVRAVRHLQDKILLTIADNGSGMDDETLNKIRSPFFTTKEKGTGLGLVITEKIISQHEGTLAFESRIGEGTMVSIILPYFKG